MIRRRRGRPLPPFVYTETTSQQASLARRQQAAQIEMWAFDQMPPRLRSEVAGSALGLNAQNLVSDMRALGPRYGLSEAEMARFMVGHLAELENEKIAAFARAYQARYRAPFPHVAAGASVLRPRNAKGSPT